MNDRIKQIRKAKGLTQVDFGKKIGVKGNTITNYENGLRTPSDSIIFSICREFNINEEWIRTGEGRMERTVDMQFSDICADIGVHDTKAREAIMKYYELSTDDKKLWWDFVSRFMK